MVVVARVTAMRASLKPGRKENAWGRQAASEMKRRRAEVQEENTKAKERSFVGSFRDANSNELVEKKRVRYVDSSADFDGKKHHERAGKSKVSTCAHCWWNGAAGERIQK